MKLLALILMLVFQLHEAQSKGFLVDRFDPYTDIISDNYEAGNGLIYDCVEKHWVCVSSNFYEECRLKRTDTKVNENSTRFPCAQIGYFPNKKSCFQRQLFMTTHHYGDRFCIKDEWKLKAN